MLLDILWISFIITGIALGTITVMIAIAGGEKKWEKLKKRKYKNKGANMEKLKNSVEKLMEIEVVDSNKKKEV